MAENYQITQLGEGDELKVLHPETNADVVLETANKKVMTAAERTKLAGIEQGAEVNIINGVKVNGTTVSPDGSGVVNIEIDDTDKIPLSQKGAAGGVAELDSSGKVPSAQLPSYVDDVLEFASLSSFPETGEDGKIYIAEDTNLTYRWSGTQYVEISASLALGETSSTAYAGNKGKQNADDIAAIKAGTIKAGDASKLNGQSASYYLDYNNLTNKPDIPTVPEIEVVDSGSGSFVGNVTADGYTITLAKKNISVSDLPNSGVTAGTYSVVTVDAKGRATDGGTILEVGSDSQAAPSANLAIGGIFFKKL